MDKIYASLTVDQPGAIRLVEIQPALRLEDAIQLRMRTASLDDPDVSYEGLSYTWGDLKDLVTVFCDDVPFQATKNLYSAFRRLREAEKPRIFWVDAICINQNDYKERAEQVKQMLRIYKQATTVWMDLGDKVEDQEEMFSLMMALDRALNEHENNTIPFQISQFEKLGLPPVHSAGWVAWQKMLARPYFTRLWTIQEFAVSTTLFTLQGKTYFPWENLYTIISRMQIHGIAEDQRPMSANPSTIAMAAIKGKNGIGYLHSVREAFQLGAPRSLVWLLWLARFVNATEAKDKVFGVMGLATDVNLNDPAFEIKYHDDESVAQLYTRVAKGLIKSKQEYMLNCLFEGGVCMNSRVKGLPSWVPDWSSPRAGSPLGDLHKAKYRAASAADVSMKINEDILCVRGRIVDKIEHLTSRFQPDTKEEHNDAYYGVSVAKWLRESFQLAQSVWPDVLTDGNDTARKSLWRTLICSKTHNDDPVLDSYSEQFDALLVRQRFVEEALEGLEDESKIMINDQGGEYALAEANCRLYRLALQNTMFTKKFCITEQRKMMAMVPGDAVVGDVVALVAGSPVPFILRRASGDEKNLKWELIQECYIHEMMDGSFAEADKVEEWTSLSLV